MMFDDQEEKEQWEEDQKVRVIKLTPFYVTQHVHVC